MAAAAQNPDQAALGIFEAHGDIGRNPRPGSLEYDRDTGQYRVTGGGANIWSSTDAFQFVWKQISGDVTFSADIHFIGTSAAEHRKAVLMIRQGLEPGAPYADAALHGDGLTSLQFRLTSGAETQEIRSAVKGPSRIRIERRGNQFTMYAGNPDEDLKASGPATVVLLDPVYVGIGVCSHNADNLETAVFSNVRIEAASVPKAAARVQTAIK